MTALIVAGVALLSFLVGVFAGMCIGDWFDDIGRAGRRGIRGR